MDCRDKPGNDDEGVMRLTVMKAVT